MGDSAAKPTPSLSVPWKTSWRSTTPLRSAAAAGLLRRDQQATDGEKPAAPIPAAPGQPERIDYEYERNGTANLFMVFEPLAGQRRVKVTERRTAIDFADVIRELVDEQYPHAEKIVLVMDNLNTHKPASLVRGFPARRGPPADWNAWKSITPPSMAVGSTWPRPN